MYTYVIMALDSTTPQARLLSFKINPGLPHWLSSKEFACNAGDPHLIPGSGNTLEKGMATHSSILAWRISWTEQPGGLQSMGSQRHRQNWSNWACTNLLYHEIPQKALKSLPQHHSSKASILGHSAFLIVQHSYPCMTTGKTIALTRWTFVGKVMSLFLIWCQRFVKAFLPKSKHLLISWLQSPSAVILES